MAPEDFWPLVGIIATGFLTVVALFLRHLDKRFDRIEEYHEDNAEKVEQLRSEIYRDFIRRSEHGQLRADISSLFERVNDCATVINERINGVSAQLNQLIGQHKGKQGT